MNAKLDMRAQTDVIAHTELNRVAPRDIFTPTSTLLPAYSGHDFSVSSLSQKNVNDFLKWDRFVEQSDLSCHAILGV